MLYSPVLLALSTILIASASALDRRPLAGQASFYGGNVAGGACSFSTYSLPAGVYGTATANWDNSNNCGACVSVQGPDGNRITAMIVDECTNCATNQLDLFPDAFAKLATASEGIIDVTWSYIDCPITAALQLHNKDGASPYYFSMQVLNANQAVSKLEVSTDGGSTWEATVRQDYNFFMHQTGFGTAKVDVQVTAEDGSTVTVKDVNVTSGASVTASRNFADSAAAVVKNKAVAGAPIFSDSPDSSVPGVPKIVFAGTVTALQLTSAKVPTPSTMPTSPTIDPQDDGKIGTAAAGVADSPQFEPTAAFDPTSIIVAPSTKPVSIPTSILVAPSTKPISIPTSSLVAPSTIPLAATAPPTVITKISKTVYVNSTYTVTTIVRSTAIKAKTTTVVATMWPSIPPLPEETTPAVSTALPTMILVAPSLTGFTTWGFATIRASATSSSALAKATTNAASYRAGDGLGLVVGGLAVVVALV